MSNFVAKGGQMKTTISKITTLITLLSLTFSVLSNVCDAQDFGSGRLARFITPEDGLPNSYVDDILIDDAGFLWAATAGGGLCRYDGYGFVTISTNRQPRIRNNFVHNIEEDAFRRIWVGSEGGLDVISIQDFSNCDILDKVPQDLVTANVSYLTSSSDGCIWAVIGENVVRIAFDEVGEVLSCNIYRDERILSNSVTVKDVERNGSVWIGIHGQVFRLSAAQDGTVGAKRILENLDCGRSTYISDFVIKDNEVWISTSAGVYRYDVTGRVGKHYMHDDGDPASLSQNYLTCIALTSDNQILVASLLGLNVYNPIEDDFERIIYTPGSPSLLNSNFINCMEVHGRNIWMGSENAGIIQIRPKQLDINNYVHQRNVPGSIAPNNVNAVYQDAQGCIWVGTVESGISCLSDAWSGFRRFTVADGGLSHNSVSEFCSDGQGRMWVGSWGGGIDVLDGKDPMRVAMNIRTCSETGEDLSFIGAMEYDPYNNLMWVGSNGGVFYCDPETGESYHSDYDQSFGCIGSLIDRRGRLWIGGQAGLQVYDLKQSSVVAGKKVFPVKHLRNKLDDPASGTLEKVSCIAQGEDGTIWVGSTGNGFYKLVEEGGAMSFVNYSTSDGLANDSVKYILEDQSGNLWISTENGLSRFNPATGMFTTYKEADGLVSNQFYWNAGLRGRDGLLYFGSTGGLSVIDPTTNMLSAAAPRPVITEVMVGSRRDNNPYLTRLDLHERDKSVTISFSDLSLKGSSSVRYSYLLEGQDKEWTDIPEKRNFVAFNSLRKGHYVLKVRAVDCEGTDEGLLSLPLRVRPYFYHSWWFYMLLLLVVSAVLMLIHDLRLRNLLRQKEKLERIVEERTAEIKTQKKLVEQKAEELSRQNMVLLRQNEELAAHRMLQESHAAEDKFAKKAIDVVREHYKDPDFDVPTFCEEIGMSKTLLNKKMQESLGQSIGQFIRNYRLSIAKEMLMNNHGDKTISEIAYEAGFNDPKYFARCFLKEVGMTPSSFGKIGAQ